MGFYFHFLATYAKALTFISVIGGGFWLLGASYSPYYSIALILWATTFVEYWKVLERKIAVRWGTYGAFHVEKLRHDYVDSSASALQRDIHKATRIAASLPIILGFVAVLAGILTTLFAIEAFITRLYTGPFHQHVVCDVSTNNPLMQLILSFLEGLSKHNPLPGIRSEPPRTVPEIRYQDDKPRKPQTPVNLQILPHR